MKARKRFFLAHNERRRVRVNELVLQGFTLSAARAQAWQDLGAAHVAWARRREFKNINESKDNVTLQTLKRYAIKEK